VTSPLRSRTFVSLWSGDATTRLGYQTAEFLLPLLAVTVLRASPVAVGAVLATQFVPVLLLSLSAGSIAARYDGRTVLVACSVARGAAMGALGAAAGLSGLGYPGLLLAALVVGAATVVHDVAYQSAVPLVVPPAQLVAGNGILQASTSVTQLAGPALAGFLVQATGASPAIVVTAALFAGGAVAFLLVDAGRIRHDTGADRPSARAGLRYTLSCRPLRDLCLQSGLFNLVEQAFLTAFLVYAVRTLGLGGGVVGLVVGVGSAGALAGSLATGRLGPRLHSGTVVSLALAAAGAAYLVGLLLAGPLPAAPVLAVAFFANGGAVAAYNVLAVSLRQTIPPAPMLAAATATYRLVSFGPIPVGALLGGVCAELVGARAAVLGLSAALGVSATTLLLSPLRRVATVEDAARLAAA
jgi:MFS family permease